MNAPDLTGNPGRFVRFGVFYNARAYYPILAILFLDLGLTLDQFVLLNLIWAATIFAFEVPSGALADTFGRKKLLVAASVLMIVEMLCLLFAPRGGGALLLTLCIVNRVCSGLSEACASGADEALAYDSLAETDRADSWDRLLATSMRWRSAGTVVAMILGGLIYDPGPLNHLLPASLHLSTDLAHRLPVALVLLQGLVCLVTTLRMVEPPRPADAVDHTCASAFKLTLKTARWIFTNPRTLVVVVLGLSVDCIVRNFAVIGSSYYRLVHLEEWTYGFIGAGIGLLGWFVPQIAKSLNARFSTIANLGIATILSLAGLAAAAPAWPYFGLLPMALLMCVMGYLGFTVSRVLHREADSSKRATVLSVKGLVFNLGYGLFSLGFSRLLAAFPHQSEPEALKSALFWQVPVFAIASAALYLWAVAWWKRAEKNG